MKALGRIFRQDLLLVLIVGVSLLLKNPFYAQPFLGHFASYQSVVAMIASEFVRNDFSNFLYPNSFTLTNGLPSLEMIYHPFSAYLAALFLKIFGGSLDYWGRFQAMMSSALGTVLIYACARRMAPGLKGFPVFAAFLFAFSPLSLIYGRAFMNESLAVTLTLLSLWLLLLARGRSAWLLIAASGLVFSAVLVLRLHFIAFFPAFLLLIFDAKGRLRLALLAVFSLTSVLLAGLWFWHTYEVTRHFSHLHTSLFAQIEARPFPDPLLFQDYFYAVLGKELVCRLLGPLPFLILGGVFVTGYSKEHRWTFVAGLATAALIFLGPSKYLDHPFYLIPLLIPAALMAAHILARLWERALPAKRELWVWGFLALSFVSGIYFFWRPAFTEPTDKKVFFEAVAFIKANVPKDGRLIASHGGSKDLLYYSERYGYTFKIVPEREELPRYFSSAKYSGLSVEEFEERNDAVRDPVKWLEYRKEKGGAEYFAVVPKSGLEASPALKLFLENTYTLISDPDENYAVYRLVNPSISKAALS